LRTARSSRVEQQLPDSIMSEFAGVQALYFGGDMEAAIALTGQVCGRIDAVRPVADIIEQTIREFHETVARLGARYNPPPHKNS
jgi:enoyl-[acyl-carrier protein] reductase II